MTNKLDWIKKSLLGSSTMPFGTSGVHVHGPHCNHDHDHSADDHGHIHGPGCNHNHDDIKNADHVHGKNCKH